MSETEDPNKPPTIVIVECSMCHAKVPFARTTLMSGRRLCLNCATSWFDDEDEEHKSG
jgi:formylmethanofuran dehydrogenase subunit E